MGLANAPMRAGDFPSAAKTYYRLAAANPNDESSWLGLIKAQVGEKAPQAAISTVQQIPPAVKQQHGEPLRLSLGIGACLLQRESACSWASNICSARSQLAGQIGFRRGTEPSSCRLPGTFMEQGKTGRAIEIYREATQSHPNNPSGWEGLVGAYTRLGNFAQAVTTVRSMPQPSYNAA